EHAPPQDLGRRFEILQTMLGPSAPLALAMLPILWALLAIGVTVAPIAGVAALAAWQLQPIIALLFTRLGGLDIIPVGIFRGPIELYMFARTVFGRRVPDLATARRPDYDQLLAGGTDRFYEPRRTTCPVCESTALSIHLRHGDLFQHKPGVFTLER